MSQIINRIRDNRAGVVAAQNKTQPCRPFSRRAALDASHHPGAPVMGRPIAAVSMHRITRPRRRLPQLFDRALDTMPDGPTFHVTLGHNLVGSLGGM